MRRRYENNPKIILIGTEAAIISAENILDSLDGIKCTVVGNCIQNEAEIRLELQEAIDRFNIEAALLFDGNTVYSFKTIIRDYDKLRKSGTLEKMSDILYNFLYLNFDIAHYDKRTYIEHYDNNFTCLKSTVLDHASVPMWYADVQRILDYIQGR